MNIPWTASCLRVWLKCLLLVLLLFGVTTIVLHSINVAMMARHVTTAKLDPPKSLVVQPHYNGVTNITVVAAQETNLTTQSFQSISKPVDESRISQSIRKQHVADACKRLVTRRWTAAEVKDAAGHADTLFVDDQRKYIYCLVPKVACTSWTRVLLVATGKVRETNPNKIPQHKVNWLRHSGRILRPLARYSADEVEYRLNNYFKFIFVRHPFERLLSAFRDRIQGDHAAARRMWTREILKDKNTTIIESQPGKRSHRNRVKGRVEFSDFARYVANPARDPRTSNQHWRSQSELCHPCHIQYDFIGHYDTIQTDAAWVINRIGAADKVRFPFEDPDNKRRMHTNELVMEAISKSSTDDVTRLRTSVYAEDFELFGFDWSNTTGTISIFSRRLD